MKLENQSDEPIVIHPGDTIDVVGIVRRGRIRDVVTGIDIQRTSQE